MERRAKFIAAEMGFLAIAAVVLGVFRYPQILPYNWYLFLHIFGVVIFVGNIVVTGAWMTMATRTHDASIIRFSSSMVGWADVFFTFPGVILIVLAGLTLSMSWGGPFGTSWLIAASTLFAISGVVSGVFLVPYQTKMVRLSQTADTQGLPPEYFSVLRKWNSWGIVATVLPVLAALIMVVKPAF